MLKVKLSPRAGNVSPLLPPAETCQQGQSSSQQLGAWMQQTDPSSSRPQQQPQLLRPLLPTQWDLHLCTPT